MGGAEATRQAWGFALLTSRLPVQQLINRAYSTSPLHVPVSSRTPSLEESCAAYEKLFSEPAELCRMRASGMCFTCS